MKPRKTVFTPDGSRPVVIIGYGAGFDMHLHEPVGIRDRRKQWIRHVRAENVPERQILVDVDHERPSIAYEGDGTAMHVCDPFGVLVALTPEDTQAGRLAAEAVMCGTKNDMSIRCHRSARYGEETAALGRRVVLEPANDLLSVSLATTGTGANRAAVCFANTTWLAAPWADDPKQAEREEQALIAEENQVLTEQRKRLGRYQFCRSHPSVVALVNPIRRRRAVLRVGTAMRLFHAWGCPSLDRFRELYLDHLELERLLRDDQKRCNEILKRTARTSRRDRAAAAPGN